VDRGIWDTFVGGLPGSGISLEAPERPADSCLLDQKDFGTLSTRQVLMSSANLTARTSEIHADANDRCRLLMVDSTGQDVFFIQRGDRYFLPEIEIPRFSRVMEEIDACVQRNWRVSATHLYSNYAPSEAAQLFLAVLEVPTGHPMACLSSCGIDQGCSQLTDNEDLEFFQKGRTWLLASQQNTRSAPFARLGWIEEVKSWVEHVPGAGTVVSHSQLSGSDDTCLARFDTSTKSLWYKAVGQSDPKEFAITTALWEWLPEYLPRILAFDSDRKAWLMESGGETALRQQADFEMWVAVVHRLATMQIASLSHALELLSKECIDARIRTLLDLEQPFFECMDTLMRQQVKNPPAPLTRDELDEVAGIVRTSLWELGALAIPDVIGHSDFNPGNILIKDKIVFIDWSAAHVGNPCLTLEYLIAHFKKSGNALPGQESLLRQVFRDQWSSFVAAEVMRQAQDLAPLVAVFASAVADDGWRNPARLALPGAPGYLRSLTRIMWREAQLLNSRRAYA
jgi:hypothetical protein